MGVIQTEYELHQVAEQIASSKREKIYFAYRGQLEHEDELIGMRNGWLVGSESFLFAAYAVLLTIPASTTGNFQSAAQQLFHELPWVGVGLAGFAFFAVGAALWRQLQLRKELGKRKHEIPDGFPDVISRGPRHVGHTVALLVPIVMTGAWIAVLMLRS